MYEGWRPYLSTAFFNYSLYNSADISNRPRLHFPVRDLCPENPFSADEKAEIILKSGSRILGYIALHIDTQPPSVQMAPPSANAISGVSISKAQSKIAIRFFLIRFSFLIVCITDKYDPDTARAALSGSKPVLHHNKSGSTGAVSVP